MRRHRSRAGGRTSIPFVLFATTLLLAGCGSGGNRSSVSSGTIEDQIGFDQAGILERAGRIEAAVAECMKRQGFDYTPVDPTYSERQSPGRAGSATRIS